MHILVIDDDDRLRQLLKDFLKKSNFKVSVSPNAFNAVKLLNEFIFDLIILDVMMPEKTGIELINELGSEFKTPILLLTALDQIDDKIKGLKSGADDYLTKPFHGEELIARCNALIRRSAGQANPEMTAGPIRIHTRSQQVWVNDKELTLTAYEYKVLEYLMVNPQKVISKSELIIFFIFCGNFSF